MEGEGVVQRAGAYEDVGEVRVISVLCLMLTMLVHA